MVVGNNGINDNKKCRERAGDFDHHVDAAVQCGAHCPMEHILGFTRSHWMPPWVGGPVQDFPPFVFFLAGTIFFEASPNRNKNRQMSNKERENF
jgi:hypothetical protein